MQEKETAVEKLEQEWDEPALIVDPKFSLMLENYDAVVEALGIAIDWCHLLAKTYPKAFANANAIDGYLGKMHKKALGQ